MLHPAAAGKSVHRDNWKQAESVPLILFRRCAPAPYIGQLVAGAIWLTTGGIITRLHVIETIPHDEYKAFRIAAYYYSIFQHYYPIQKKGKRWDISSNIYSLKALSLYIYHNFYHVHVAMFSPMSFILIRILGKLVFFPTIIAAVHVSFVVYRIYMQPRVICQLRYTPSDLHKQATIIWNKSSRVCIYSLPAGHQLKWTEAPPFSSKHQSFSHN